MDLINIDYETLLLLLGLAGAAAAFFLNQVQTQLGIEIGVNQVQTQLGIEIAVKSTHFLRTCP